MVEDAAEDFQKLQDISHAKIMKATLRKLSQEEPAGKYLPVPDSTITSPA